jgi:hypothetical protein
MSTSGPLGGDNVKSVRYVAGVAGLAPAAFGMFGATAVHAAGTAPAPTTPGRAVVEHGKLVSVRPAGVKPDTGCTGDTRWGTTNYSPNGDSTDVSAHFWWTQHGDKTCIGTVVLSMTYNKSICKSGWAYIYWPSYEYSDFPTGKYCGKKGYTYGWDFGAHVSHSNPITVCAASTYTSPARGPCTPSVP